MSNLVANNGLNLSDIATGNDIKNKVAGKIIDATSILNEDGMITNSNEHTITQSSLVEYIKNQIAGGVTYKGYLTIPTIFDGVTNNKYLDSVTDVKTGNMFVAVGSGEITLSDGNINVSNGDALIVNTSNPKNAITKAMLDDISPSYPSTSIGEYKIVAVSNANAGWVICQSQAVSRTTYSVLFGVIGTTFGAGDGSTTFNMPDASGRALVFAGQGTGLTNRDVGQLIGEESVTLTEAQLASHLHTINHDHGSFTSGSGGNSSNANGQYGLIRISDGGNNTLNSGDNSPGEPDLFTRPASWAHNHDVNIPNYSGNSGSSGSGQAHNNTQASLVAGYLFMFAGV